MMMSTTATQQHMPTDSIQASQIVSAMYDFLGPAAERFVSRMMQTHLHKDPHDALSPEDVKTLSEKVQAALKHLDQDPATAESAKRTILGLIQ